MKREEIQVEDTSAISRHYSPAVRYGDLLFVSGMVPLDENLDLVGGSDAATQARQVFLNMQKTLEAAGADFSNVLSVTLYLTDVSDRQSINSVREEFFADTRPASTLIGVSELAIPGIKVEVEAIAGLTS